MQNTGSNKEHYIPGTVPTTTYPSGEKVPKLYGNSFVAFHVGKNSWRTLSLTFPIYYVVSGVEALVLQ